MTDKALLLFENFTDRPVAEVQNCTQIDGRGQGWRMAIQTKFYEFGRRGLLAIQDLAGANGIIATERLDRSFEAGGAHDL